MFKEVIKCSICKKEATKFITFTPCYLYTRPGYIKWYCKQHYKQQLKKIPMEKRG